MKNVWNELMEYQTRDLIEKYISQKYDRRVNAWQVYEIASNFIQGREYFESAEKSGETVRPLLLYYGVLALSRGLTLALSPHISESSLKPSHGLDIKNWPEVLKSRSYENINIFIGDGSFSQLINATKNANLLRANSSIVNLKAFLKTPQRGDKVVLGDLIQYFPDLSREYSVWLGKPLCYGILHNSGIDNQGDNLVIRITSEIPENSINLMFPDIYCIKREVSYSSRETKIVYENHGWYPNLTQKWDSHFNIGEACVIPSLPNDTGYNILGSMFIVSYTLGMMARYFPTNWISLRRIEKGDKMYPFANRILSFIQEKYPVAVLDFLRDNNNWQG
jgi:hypothetical protein